MYSIIILLLINWTRLSKYALENFKQYGTIELTTITIPAIPIVIVVNSMVSYRLKFSSVYFDNMMQIFLYHT